MSDYHYAAWVVFDLRLFLFVVAISALLSVGLVALFFRGHRWHEYATGFIAIFAVVTVVTLLVFNSIAAYPVFLIEDIFPFP